MKTKYPKSHYVFSVGIIFFGLMIAELMFYFLSRPDRKDDPFITANEVAGLIVGLVIVIFGGIITLAMIDEDLK